MVKYLLQNPQTVVKKALYRKSFKGSIMSVDLDLTKKPEEKEENFKWQESSKKVKTTDSYVTTGEKGEKIKVEIEIEE
jgi:uncharacterized protein (DUF1919 family)